MLAMLLKRRWVVPVAAALILTLGGVMLNFVGRDFFPAIDGGQIKLHVRAPPETRIETT
jgi:multidrug efflux pump subunit AcrB